jgi:hypothetical protein
VLFTNRSAPLSMGRPQTQQLLLRGVNSIVKPMDGERTTEAVECRSIDHTGPIGRHVGRRVSFSSSPGR